MLTIFPSCTACTEGHRRIQDGGRTLHNAPPSRQCYRRRYTDPHAAAAPRRRQCKRRGRSQELRAGRRALSLPSPHPAQLHRLHDVAQGTPCPASKTRPILTAASPTFPRSPRRQPLKLRDALRLAPRKRARPEWRRAGPRKVGARLPSPAHTLSPSHTPTRPHSP